MTNDTKLDELGDRLERSAAADLRSERGASGAAVQWARRRRSRLVAGSSLGLAGVAAAVLFGVSGTATTSPAFAVAKHDDGSVLVTLNREENLGQANQKLAAMGIDEQITLYPRRNPSGDRSPEECAPAPGTGAPNPPIRLIVDAPENADNTGTTSAVSCVVGPRPPAGADRAPAHVRVRPHRASSAR